MLIDVCWIIKFVSRTATLASLLSSMTTWTLSSTLCTLWPTSPTLSHMLSILPSTTFTSSRMLCVILRTSASAIRASSCVNLSSLLSASSRSALPANFFRNFFALSS
ncbi:hypothetical protein BJY52DRAFT_1269988 [Lactarius psammicola]|nr:hypothetical protein BJY52DRAFT_1269988 [Lactarius psammicola]